MVTNIAKNHMTFIFRFEDWNVTFLRDINDNKVSVISICKISIFTTSLAREKQSSGSKNIRDAHFIIPRFESGKISEIQREIICYIHEWQNSRY
jgi:hypothetical protein